MRGLILGVTLMLPTAVSAETDFIWSDETSAQCRAYFDASYLEQARAVPPAGMADAYCNCVMTSLTETAGGSNAPRLCSLAVNQRFQSGPEPLARPASQSMNREGV